MQNTWLTAQLGLVDRCITPWLVLITHRPLYVIRKHRSNRIMAAKLRRNLEPLLKRHGVNVVVSGHVHSYSRTCQVSNTVCVGANEGGIPHIVAGTGGHKISKIGKRQKDWTEVAMKKFGFVHLDFRNATYMRM